MIHEEWIRNLLVNRADLKRRQLEVVRDLMDENVPGSVVAGFEGLIDSIELPDKDDRHVVAAALQTHAEAIITFNLKDFPDEELSKYGMTALHPDDFIVHLIEINVGAVIEAARRHRRSLKSPPFTATEYLDLLLRQNLPATVSKLKPYGVTI